MDDPQGNSPNNLNKAPTIQFRAQDINTAKSSQTDFFAKHRQEYATKQERKRKIRRRVIICASVAAPVVIAIIIFAIILHQPSIIVADEEQIPPDMEIWNGAAQKIESTAQGIYDTEQNVDEYFDQQISEASTDAEKINLVLVEMQFYANNFQPEDVVAVASKINVNQLTTSQVGVYGGLLMNAYINIGDNTMAEYYLNLMEEKDAIGGGEG